MTSDPIDDVAAAFDSAVAVFGSQQALAEVMGVTKGRVSQWRIRVPLERCIQIEAATRRAAAERKQPALVVTCEELRPDIEWRVLRDHPPKARPARLLRR